MTKFQMNCVLINQALYVRANNIYLKLMFSCTTLDHRRNKNRSTKNRHISHCPITKQNKGLRASIVPDV